MQLLLFYKLAIFLLEISVVHAAPSPSFYPPDAVDLLAFEGIVKLAVYQAETQPNSKCTVENAAQRKEWADLSAQDRIAYTDAVLCLQSKPPISSPDIVPGARSRGRYAADPIHSPIFDGSATSMSGNGLYYNHTGVEVPGAPPPYDIIPAAVGGGCVTTGPFKNMSVNLGPMAASISGVPPNPQADGFGYNPRCLRRDVNPYSAAVTATNYTYALVTKPQNADIYWFQTDMQGIFPIGEWGVHTGGHFTIGGDPGGDFFTSPGDPAFFLHHGMIDRVWWIWQLQDLANRLTAVSGTLTFENEPPSANTTLDDSVDLGYNAPGVRLGDLLTTIGGLDGELCYVYV